MFTGVFRLEIMETLRIEGALQTNGEGGKGTSGAGAGGSILVYTHNFDGEGILQVNGGPGNLLLFIIF